MSGIEKHRNYLLVIFVIFCLSISLYSGDIKGKISSDKKTARKVAQRYPGKHVQSAKKPDRIRNSIRLQKGIEPPDVPHGRGPCAGGPVVHNQII